MTWSIESVVVGAREALCGAARGTRDVVCEAIQGTLAWMWAPVLDIVYPPDSEPEIPMVGCPNRADCREFSCAGYCSGQPMPAGPSGLAAARAAARRKT